MGSREIPPDIVFEILTRIKSLATLDTCKSVCKEWNQMIQESSFMATYCQRTRNLSGVMLNSMFVAVDHQSEEEHSSSIDLYMDNVQILASCNQGILCCLKMERDGPQHYVCKPATKQWQSLPNPKYLPYETAAVAITVLKLRPFRYKIIRLLLECPWDYRQYIYRCEIFNSQVWRWREVQPLISELIGPLDPSVNLGGSFHWLTVRDDVIQFYQEREYFHKFPVPNVADDNNHYRCKTLCNYQGKLGFICRSLCNMELWVAKTGAIRWTKELTVNLENLKRNVVNIASFYGADSCPAIFYRADIAIFMITSQRVVFYKLQDGSFHEVLLNKKMRNEVGDVFQFRSDFEPVELRGTRGWRRSYEF